jgi:hypothetical protein
MNLVAYDVTDIIQFERFTQFFRRLNTKYLNWCKKLFYVDETANPDMQMKEEWWELGKYSGQAGRLHSTWDVLWRRDGRYIFREATRRASLIDIEYQVLLKSGR